MKARINEIFSSIQGEGIYPGIRQIFIRLYPCNLNCRFCDTKLFSFKEYTLQELYQELEKFGNAYDSLAITGGEPLLQAKFLSRFLKQMKAEGLAVYLETNGVLHNALRDVMEYVDIIAMDIKLPSSTGMRPFWDEHRKFLEVGLKKEIFVKTVISSDTTLEDMLYAVGLIAGFNKDIPLVLQPNSYEMGAELIKKLESFRKVCRESLSDVRIMPQIHKLIGVK